MVINEVYFRRQQRERGEFPDVYQYEELPQKLKVQIVHIWRESLGIDRREIRNRRTVFSKNRGYYLQCYKILSKELGVFYLNERDEISDFKSIINVLSKYFLRERNIDICLSIIELIAQQTYEYANDYKNDIYFEFEEVVDELNQRFREHGVGYQYENGQIIRVDSQFIHAEMVKPALQLLSDKMYQGAQDEFLKAHEFYRNQDYKNMMVECLKAYESTLKVIIQKHDWNYNPKDTADALTGKALQNGLVPDYWIQYFKGLKNTLTAGLPTARNNEGGHGQGEEIRTPPDYLASYVLHMTASAIVFLAKAEQALND